MNVSIVGCGGIAEIHANYIKSLGNNLLYVVNHDINSAKAFAEKWDIANATTDIDEALGKEIDCIHICTPPALHYMAVKKALLAGKHVICEKPLCLLKEEARELHELAKQKGLINAVNFNNRYYAACQESREIISALGEINLVHGYYLQEFHSLPAPYSWRYKEDLAGDMRAVTEIASHWIDLVRFLCNFEIEEVSAHFICSNKKRHLKDGIMYAEKLEGSVPILVESEDAAFINFKFSNAAFGNLVVSEISNGNINNMNIEINAQNKSLSWNSEHPYQINLGRKDKGINTISRAFSSGFESSFADFFKAVYFAINNKDGNRIFADFEDGMINAAVCQAIYESANKDSKWIKVSY